MKTKDLLKAYKVITEIMETNKLTMDTSFRRVQCWLSNAVCNSLKDEDKDNNIVVNIITAIAVTTMPALNINS